MELPEQRPVVVSLQVVGLALAASLPPLQEGVVPGFRQYLVAVVKLQVAMVKLQVAAVIPLVAEEGSVLKPQVMVVEEVLLLQAQALVRLRWFLLQSLLEALALRLALRVASQ